MIKNVKKVTVKYNGKTVGYLAEIEPDVIGFQYDGEWLKTGFNISPFSLPLNDRIFVCKKTCLTDYTGFFGILFPMVGENCFLPVFLQNKV